MNSLNKFLMALAAAGVATSIHTTAAAATCTGGPAVCGQSSGLVPTHKDAIAASLLWNGATASCPMLIIWGMRSEYQPHDYLNPTVGGDFAGFNPTFQNLVNANIPMDFLDENGWSRYTPDLTRDDAQLFDVCGLQSLIDTGVFTTTTVGAVSNTDLSRTDPYRTDVGYSQGLYYNLICAGNVTGVDGKLYVIGGHDKASNVGIAKMDIFDPTLKKWKLRAQPCVRSQWAADPTGTTAHCDALNEANTDPADPSDMKYDRWYGTGVTLPDGRILILSGSDETTKMGKNGAPIKVNKVRQAVPEVYDPKTDTTIALPDASMLLNMFPRAFVVQTGPGVNDWKVAVIADVVPPLPGQPGGLATSVYDPYFYSGQTQLLDVQGALADPSINVPAQNHWTYVATAANAHDDAAAVMMVKIQANGSWSQEVYAFGGANGGGAANVATVEKINFADSTPQWQQIASLDKPARRNNAVALPDGNILVVGGGDETAGNTYAYQLFNTTYGSHTDLVSTTVPRHDHSTALLLPNGGVWVMGGNRTQLIPGTTTQAQRDTAVPVLDSFKPPYFFGGTRPTIMSAPNQITYGQSFTLTTSGTIGSVALMRTGPVTHHWAWGNTYVQLPFTVNLLGQLVVTSPPLPGLAIGGDYLLFVVNQSGIPSTGVHVRLQ